ncbi:hypothetical protein PYW08_006900 [Mythimna loreyi]|uniref:Uncharacterized protein n=1 Tax=Mythimna loreyi TaxID=667449 RepID=A0ACC2R874_9NEOP|nr:hypothetical protein PYW08_006900 [Mythimna loreyi]
MPHCCAFGCKDTSIVMHSFPNPDKFPERFKAWVNLVGNKLEALTDYDIYKKKRICDIHFTDEHRNRFKRLNALAVPTLYLPGESHRITGVFNLSFNHPTTSTSLPSTSTPDETYSVAATTQEASGVNHPSTSTSLLATTSSDRSHCTATTNFVTMEHNYSVISKLNKKGLLKDARERVGVQFNCIQMRPFHQKLKYLRNEIGRLRKKEQSFKKRLANAEKLCNEAAFQQVTKNMTKPAQLFVHMQLQSTKKPKGRRFSLEEKVMSLSLFKKSPKCYRLLCKYFALPSAKAMMRLLSQIKLVPGINPIVFKKIKKGLAEKDVPDRLCSLIFDEMSIMPQVLYNAHKDELEGFASNQENSFADHALVFMVKGVKNNFKQPIAYYFTSGLKKNELQILIKSVVQHALESSLIVVNTESKL